MANEFEIRRITDDDDGDWYDLKETWGLRVLNDSPDLMIRGEVQAYSYQHITSNKRSYIVIKDEDGKVVRECASLTLSVLTDTAMATAAGGTVLALWNNFVDFISEDAFELRSVATFLSNTYSLDGELNPSPTIGVDGSITNLTCGIQLKQLEAK